MSSPQAPGSLGVKKAPRALKSAAHMLFWLGFGTEDSNHDLEYYIKNLHPRLSGIISRHRYLRQSLSLLRTSNPWIMLTFMFLSSIFVHPVAIYLHWGDINVVVENCFILVFWIYLFIVYTGVFLRRNLLKKLIVGMDTFIIKLHLDNEEQKNMLYETHVLCGKIFKFLHFIFVPISIIGGLGYAIVACVPVKMQIFSGWYPYDETATPAFELTLLSTLIIISLIFLAGNSCTSTLISVMIYSKVCFKIICNKCRNIRSISFGIIKKRKLLQGQRSRKFWRLQVGDNGDTSARHHIIRTNITVEVLAGQGHSIGRLPPLLGRITNVSSRDKKRVNAKKFCKKISKHEVDAEMRLQLAKFVECHNDVLYFMNGCGNALNFLFVAMFALNVVVYGGIILVFTYVETVTVKTMLLTITSLEIVCCFLALNILGNSITDQSAGVGYALYECDWLGASTSFKRAMLVVMAQANKPAAFKPPGLDPLSVRNFGQVISLAYKMATRLMGIIQK